MDTQERVAQFAGQFARACQITASVLEYGARDFVRDMAPPFCAHCRLYADGRCDYRNTHLYGSFEAERWQGLYVYYCPLSLGFIATTVYQEGRAELALITGPLVIGSLADTIGDGMGVMIEPILALPTRSPEDTTALSRVQQALCQFLSGRQADQLEAAEAAQARMHNVLYAVTAEMEKRGGRQYPLALERRLQRMITNGDRQGAQELINQLLGEVYFSTDGDFRRIRDNAKALLVLFSRAAIEGGADAQQIFGDMQGTMEAMDRFSSLDELSAFLTGMFYRFVSYVFDFTHIKNTDLVHKVLSYVRGHYTEKITLDDVAAHVYLSRSYLSRVLSEELGMSFSDFVNAMRIEKSKELLEYPELTLAEISELTGFSDQSYFTKVFHKIVGVSPGEYRKRRGRR